MLFVNEKVKRNSSHFEQMRILYRRVETVERLLKEIQNEKQSIQDRIDLGL